MQKTSLSATYFTKLMLFLIVAFLTTACANLQNAKSSGQGNTYWNRDVHFATNEGTWMSVDVAPDGETVVFDLLGRIYAVPITGGRAHPLTDPGEAWDLCARFSPDGKNLAFLSDRDGPTDIWLMDWSTNALRRISGRSQRAPGPLGTYGIPCAPRWSPDDATLIVIDNYPRDSKPSVHSISTNSAPFVNWTKSLAPLSDTSWSHPTAVIPLGEGDKAIADVQFITLSGAVKRDLFWLTKDNGELERLRASSAEGQAFRPELSNSGRLLAYVRRTARNENELRLHDLATGIDRRLTDLRNVDDLIQHRELPGYSFTPDDRFIVLGYGGKLHKISVADGTDEIIPFQAKIARKAAGRLRASPPLTDGPMSIRAQRWPNLSSDKARLVFSAAGSIWMRDLPDGEPHEIGSSNTLNTMANLSPDGQKIAYVAFDYSPNAITSPGRLKIQPIDGEGALEVTDDGASYYYPVWSPDQNKLAVLRRSDDDGAAQLGWIDLADNTFHDVVLLEHYLTEDLRGNHPRWISWSDDGERLFFQMFKGWSQRGYREPIIVEEIRLDGSSRRTLASAGLDVYAIIPTPDLSHAAIIGWDQNAYLVELGDLSAGPAEISINMSGAKRISDVGALYPHWVDNERIIYGWMDRVFEYRIGQESASEVSQTNLTLPRRQGSGFVAFRNARLVTVANDNGAGPVIERGTILIKDRRILEIGEVETVSIPGAAKVIDATGLTIMPGLIDTHYHGVEPETLAFYKPETIDGGDRALAYGLTTAFEPGGGSIDDSSEDWRALLETGRFRGPRWLFDSVKDIPLRPDDAEETLPNVIARLRRKQELGQGPCVKEIDDYNGVHSRLVAQAAGEIGACMVVHVGNRHPIYSVARVASGMALHHNSMFSPFYADVSQFMAQAEMSWTPHAATHPDADLPVDLQRRDTFPFLLSRHDAIMDDLDKQRFSRFYGDQQSFRTMIDRYANAPDFKFEEGRRPQLLVQAKRLHETGVHMSLSAHDPFGLLGGEMDVWLRGGMTAEQIIRAATLGGAEQLGLQDDLGSLQPGKIADFLVLKANPLEDVLKSLRLKWTVIDGVVYDSITAKQVDPDTLN